MFPFFLYYLNCVRCRSWDTQQSCSRHEQPRGRLHPYQPNFFIFFYFSTTPYFSAATLHFTWTCLLWGHTPVFLFFFSEGEVKERRRLLMYLITRAHRATVSCLVCSKSSDTPLGKMRGLITVKLANEQVNYRTKFLYKNCHFSERCSRSCSKSLKKRGGRRVEEEKRRMLFPPVSRKLPGFCPS